MQTDRLAYVVAALTIVRAYITAERPKMAKGRTASFEHWGDLVPQPICWLAQHVATAKATAGSDNAAEGLPTLADPMEAAARAFEQDPETTKLRALVEAWFAAFGPDQTTVGGAIRRSDTDALPAMAMDDMAGRAGKINSRMLSRWIERMQGASWMAKGLCASGTGQGCCIGRCINRQAGTLRPRPWPCLRLTTWQRSECAA